MMITVVRSGKSYTIHNDGVKIVVAYKFTKESGFGVELQGVFWRFGSPNKTGGSTNVDVPRLKDVPAFVEEALRTLGTE